MVLIPNKFSSFLFMDCIVCDSSELRLKLLHDCPTIGFSSFPTQTATFLPMIHSQKVELNWFFKQFLSFSSLLLPFKASSFWLTIVWGQSFLTIFHLPMHHEMTLSCFLLPKFLIHHRKQVFFYFLAFLFLLSFSFSLSLTSIPSHDPVQFFLLCAFGSEGLNHQKGG